MNEVKLSEFFDQEYIDFSTYDNVRKISSYIDGCKNVTRKILHTLRENNVNTFTKVSNLGPRIQDATQYLHGALDGSIVNMTANYVGSGNNIPLLEGDGNFGSAFIPAPAASRYIFARQNDIIKDIFTKDDTELLPEQYFEGDKIEPRYYVPTIPMMLVNGNEGMSIGFAQKILPRNPREIIKWVNQRATGKHITANLEPYWEGMTCTVEAGETHSQWLIKGSFTRKSKNNIIVDSIPVGYSLKQYQNILDKLVDDKIIRNYDDLSDDDVFKFEINADKQFVAQADDKIITKLKLVKTVTENYTCIDENNKIIQFSNAKEILEAWWSKRLEYNQLRKDNILSKLSNENKELNLKKMFITGVVDGAIELRNASEAQVISSAIAYNDQLSERAKTFMNLPMRVLTKEEIKKLDGKIKENEAEIKEWQSKTLETISIDDVKNLESVL